jgi:hypothetical protein
MPLPFDWNTERDALVRETMAFVAKVSQHTPVSNSKAAADRGVGDVERRPLASIDRERREAFAATALQQIRSRASDRMEYSQMRAAITTA